MSKLKEMSKLRLGALGVFVIFAITSFIVEGLDNAVGTAIGLFIIFMIGHMIIVLIEEKKLSVNYTVDKFKENRVSKGLPEASTAEEIKEAENLLEAAYYTWSFVFTEDGEELRKPGKMKEVVASGALLKQVADMNPTDQDIVGALNNYADVVNSNGKRTFTGSWKFIGIVAIVGVIMLFGMKSGSTPYSEAIKMPLIFLWIPAALYYVSSLTPNFLIDNRGDSFLANFKLAGMLTAITGGILGSGTTVRTHYTDGSHSDDHSGHFIALALGFIVMVVFAFLTLFLAAFNYIRNYVLYI